MSAIPLDIACVAKSYDGKRQVLQNISFALRAGEMFGLVGLNGAGKTTLIKIILDLINSDEGGISLYGHPSTEVAARRHLSYLPEKFQPSRYLKGYEFLELSLAYYGRKLERAQARGWAEKLDLNPDVLDQRVGTYSKGMGQKLGLAAAFMIGAPLLILDEPMSGLDPQARIMLKEALINSKREGKTVFFSSHILSDIDEICDRIGIIHHGKLHFVGTPAEFKALHQESSLERAFLRLLQTTASA